MNDDILGKNPLDEDIDSIWDIPVGRQESLEASVPVKESPGNISSEQDETEKITLTESLQPHESEYVSLAAELDSPITSVLDDEGLEMPLSKLLTLDSDTCEHTTNDEKENIIQIVGFIIGDEYYGIDIMLVQEIIRRQEITRVPKSQEFVMGVSNLRGRVVPIVSLRYRFALPEIEYTKDSRVIITNLDVGTIGFVVDNVSEIISFPSRLIEPPPDTSFSIDSEYIKGVGKVNKHLIIMLDLNKVLIQDK